DPVAEGRQRAHQRRVLAPALVGVQRDAAAAMPEHRCRLGVDPGLEQADHCRAAPQDHRADPPEDSQSESEAAEQEAGVAQRDDESVVPAQRLEELYLLDGGSSQASSLLIFAARRWPHPREHSPTPVGRRYTSLYKLGQTGIGKFVRTERGGCGGCSTRPVRPCARSLSCLCYASAKAPTPPPV